MLKDWHLLSPLSLTETDNGMAAFSLEIDQVKVSKKPEEVSADILKYLMEYASEYLGEPVTEAVISVPAVFSVAQRKATKKAAELAGLKVLRLISEPVAGALHCVADRQITQKLLVFDFGGGTLDISLIDVTNQTFEVKSVCGDCLLGGRNIDNKLINHFYVPSRTNRNVARNFRKLAEGCIKLKEYLSKRDKVNLVIPDYHGDGDLELTMDRGTFEKLNEDIFQKAIDVMKTCLRNSNCDKESIQQVILIGGSTRIPKIRSLLEDFFGCSKIHMNVNPDEAVAAGACLQAAVLTNEYPSLECYRIREVTSLSLGIWGYGNLTEVVIPRNTKLPAERSTERITIKNGQIYACFEIIEGERKNSLFNNQLGSFIIENLPKKRAGDVIFEVTFLLDEDGILNVTATEKTTGMSNNLTITMDEFRLSNYQIDTNIEEAIKQKEIDDMFEHFIIQRNLFIKECNIWDYDNDDVDIREKCKQFIEFAENLEIPDLELLNGKFAELKEQILNKIE